nr:putative uncharacterized protein DDB_G0289963 [Danaus plexippus plexippus]
MAMKNGSEILEIADRPSVIQISEPTTQPTMQREALILDIIEGPCKTAEQAKECKEDDPDLDQTIRPFTNGHGYQFEDNSDEENSNEENKNDRRNESKKYSNDDKHDGNESKNEEEKGKKDSIGDQKDSKESPKENLDNENDENMGDKGKKELREDKKDGPEIEIHDSEGKKESNGIMKHGNEDINESKKTRRKRAIRSPPPPPVLPPMDVNMFPSFIRNMISNIPVLRNMLAETDTERPAQDGSRPRTYGFHLNQDKATVFNHLYDTPNYTGNKFNKNGERIEKSKAAYEPDDSDSDTDDDDSGDEDNAGTDDDEDKADDGDYGDKVNYITPYNGLNYKKAVTEEPKLKTGNNKDCKQNKPTGEKIVVRKYYL